MKMDYTGNITQTQVITLAQGLGIQDAVVGTVALKQERNKPARLEAYLRVIKVAAGKIGGEITREVGLEDVSNQEGALDWPPGSPPSCTAFSAPAARRRARRPPHTGPEPEKPAGGDAPASQAEVPGRWTLNFRPHSTLTGRKSRGCCASSSSLCT